MNIRLPGGKESLLGATTGLIIAISGIGPLAADPVHHYMPAPEFASIPYNPPNRGAPGQTRDAGSRPLCETPDKPLTAIAPLVNWGETTTNRPTFWLYVPYVAGDMEFFLRDEQTQTELYRTTFDVPTAGGILPFTLPADAPPLEPDKVYNWQFDFICNPESRSKFRVSGMIVRRSTPPELEQNLAEASPREQAILLAENGLWYDALETIAMLYRQSPHDPQLAQDWESLLRHPIVDLEDMVTEPILN